MNVARRSYTVAAAKGFIFVAGGVNSFAQESIERYDPMKNEWMRVATINWGVVHNLIEWKDHLYAIGSQSNVERYDMERDEWVSQYSKFNFNLNIYLGYDIYLLHSRSDQTSRRWETESCLRSWDWHIICHETTFKSINGKYSFATKTISRATVMTTWTQMVCP